MLLITSSFSPSPISLINMPANHLLQRPTQAWIWEPPMAMDSHHQLHYFQQLDQQQQQQGSGRREHMFEKPLTPSDVGKLNRLVIPKQHAERYFPLDSESGEKGLLLSFEDESGKPWRFRYSYWTSSQSYVLTKGWSRFVKEKKLDAGDIVHFERCRPGGDETLYIGCRRRGSNDAAATSAAQSGCGSNAALPWTPTFYGASSSYPTTSYYYNNQEEQAGGAAAESTAVMPAASARGNSKRLRLFGVNLECMPTNASSSQL